MVSGSSAAQFRAFRDPSLVHGGHASARLEALHGDVDGAATLMQSVSPEAYRGKRVRFSGFVATEGVTGWTGLWMRVDRAGGTGAFDNMQDRALHGTTAWTATSVVLDVADDASGLGFGLLQDGPGVSHLDDAALDIVGPDVPVTAIDQKPQAQEGEPDRPTATTLRNGDFEAGVVEPWVLGGGSASHYKAVLDREVRYHGQASVCLLPQGSQRLGYAAVTQSIAARELRGARVRLTAAIKTADASGELWVNLQGPSAAADGADLGWSGYPLVGTADWRTYAIVIDVPPDSDAIEIGAMLRQRGTLWLDDVHLEAVGRDVALAPADAPATLVNGGFEAGSGDQTEGWFMSGGASAEFDVLIDRTEHAAGAASARLRPRVAHPSGYGTLMQAISADELRGKRLRMTARVKGEGITGRGDLWLRVQAADSPDDGPGLGGGGCRLARSFAWKPCEIVFDVPEAGASIQLGVGLAGPGTLWLDDVRLEEVSRDVPVTRVTGPVPARLRPINLDFEAASPTASLATSPSASPLK